MGEREAALGTVLGSGSSPGSQPPAVCDPTDEHSALLHAGKGFAGVAGSMGTAPPASECGQFESLCVRSHSEEVPRESLGTGMGR